MQKITTAGKCFQSCFLTIHTPYLSSKPCIKNMLLLYNIPTILIWKRIFLLSFCVFQLPCIKSLHTLQEGFLSFFCSNICTKASKHIYSVMYVKTVT